MPKKSNSQLLSDILKLVSEQRTDIALIKQSQEYNKVNFLRMEKDLIEFREDLDRLKQTVIKLNSMLEKYKGVAIGIGAVGAIIGSLISFFIGWAK